MGEARHPWHSIGIAEGAADKSGSVAGSVEALWDAIVRALQSQASTCQRTEYTSFEHAAELAFATHGARFSRYTGPIAATNRLVSAALQSVAASADAAAFVLDSAHELLPHVAGASATEAWALIDLIETALWCIDEPEFTLLRAGRLLLLSYCASRHSVLHPQHALAMAVLLAPLGEVDVADAQLSGNVPLVVRLLVALGQRGAPSSCPKDTSALYWADCEYLRLGVNAAYGVRASTLLDMISSPLGAAEDSLSTSRGGGRPSGAGRLSLNAGRMSVCTLVALMLLARSPASPQLDLGATAARLHMLLAAATDELGRVDGPALVLKRRLEVVVDTAVWLLALQGAPPLLRDNKPARRAAERGCESAVTILCVGTALFRAHACIGACLLLRSYARSVHALRTEQIVSEARTDELCAALKRLLVEEPEHGVDEAVAGLLCNLLIDFSRLREPLIRVGIIPVMCEALRRNQTHAMLVSTLWALRNVCALRDAVEVERLAFRSLDRVGLLKPLLANDDREVTRLFCALLGNVSPPNLGELYGLLGGRKVVVQYLAQRIEYWQWPAVQEAASQALANLTAALTAEDSGLDALLTQDLCQAIVRCLQHAGASQTLLANVGYMISNALLMPDCALTLLGKSSSSSSWQEGAPPSAAKRSLGRVMLEEGVFEALTQIDSPMLSVRNSLVTARNALEVVIFDTALP